MVAQHRTRIVEAAALLLREGGLDAVTTRAVARAAGVQAPTIYRLFGDKDGLVQAVAEHVMATYVAAKTTTLEARGARADPVADLRSGWGEYVEFGLANPDLFVLLNSPRRHDGPSAATQAGSAVLQTRVRRLAAAGRLRVEEARAVALIHAAGLGTVLALLQTPPPRRDLGLVEEAYGAVAAVILTDAPPTGPEDATLNALVTLAGAVAGPPGLPGLSGAERALMGEWLARSLSARRAT